jgi:hypothetical protein
MPKHPTKHPRTFHADEAEAHRTGLREDYSEICRLKPFTYQLELAELYRQNQFFAVRWPRQTGKSTSIGGLLLQDAYENP